MDANRTFEFTEKRIGELLSRDIFGSNESAVLRLRRVFLQNGIAEKPKHLAVHGGPYSETATVFKGPSTSVLIVTACFDYEPPHILLCASFRRCSGGQLKTTLDLSGMGLQSPQTEEQAVAALREIGNVIRYVAKPEPLKYAGILREFEEWARIPRLPQDHDSPLPLGLLREIGEYTPA